MAAFALTMKGVFQIQLAGSCFNVMAVVTWFHRLALAPDVAALGKVVMAGSAVQAGLFVGLVPEQDRRLGPGLEFFACQGADRVRFRGAQGGGAYQDDNCQGQQDYFRVSSSALHVSSLKIKLTVQVGPRFTRSAF
jgi:hypothetical protein